MTSIKQALKLLDPTDDEQWTADGLPRVEAVAAIMGSEVTRRQITDAAPDFMRQQDSEPTPEPDPKQGEHPLGDPRCDPPPEVLVELSNEPVEEPSEAPLAEDPQDAARVQIHDQVVAMSEVDVVGNVARMERAITEFGRQATILVARGEAIKRRLRDVGRRSARWQAVLNRRGRGSSDHQNRDAIRRYLAVQQASRAARVERAQKFIEAGTNAADVKAQLEGASKIDAAMKNRKPSKSSIRPAYPVLTQ